MNVGELIDLLSDHPLETEVKVVHKSGDYWNTLLASDVNRVEEGKIEHSSYHNQDKVVDEGDDDDEDFPEGEPNEVLLIYINNVY